MESNLCCPYALGLGWSMLDSPGGTFLKKTASLPGATIYPHSMITL